MWKTELIIPKFRQLDIRPIVMYPIPEHHEKLFKVKIGEAWSVNPPENMRDRMSVRIIIQYECSRKV